MRIIPITINTKNTIRTNSHIQNRQELSKFDSDDFLLPNISCPYFVNFKGYSEDVEFLNNAKTLVDNMLSNVDFAIRYNFNDDNKYYAALDTLKEDDLYKKITASPSMFNELEKGFKSFDKLVLESIEDVRNNNKHFTQYWTNNCKIGDKKIVDIINNLSNSEGKNINSILKNSSDVDFGKIKEEIIKEWFAFASENFEKNKGNSNLENNIKELEEYFDRESAVRFVENAKNSLTNNFNNNTKEKILSSNVTTEQKINALDYLLSFVQAKLLEDKGFVLEQDFRILNQVRKQLQFAKEKESILFAKDAIRSLHSLAFQKWEKDNLNIALNTKINKEIFIKQEEKKNPTLRYCQNYPNFNTDEKYFVARYFNTRYKTNSKYDYDNNDYLWQIVNDRHNTVPARETVQEMIFSIKNNQDSYFAKLDSMYDLLSERKYLFEDFKLPERKVESPDDDLSFCDLYINKLDKYDKFKRKSESEKLDYLTKLTLSEMILLNADLKNDWLKNIQPYALIEEVNRQARNTSIFKKMFEELKNISENLTEIKIKTNDISLSLKDALTNSATFSNLVSDETPIKLSQQISELQRTYNDLPTEAKENVDKKLVKVIPEIQKSLSTNKLDSEIEKTLLAMSKIEKEKEPTSKFLNMLQHAIIFRSLNQGISKGSSVASKMYSGMQASKSLMDNFTDQIKTSVYKDFAPMMSHFTTIDTISNAAPSVALGSAAGNSGVLESLMTAATSNPQVAVVAVAVAACGGLIVSGAMQAGKLEKGQRNLLFSIEI